MIRLMPHGLVAILSLAALSGCADQADDRVAIKQAEPPRTTASPSPPSVEGPGLTQATLVGCDGISATFDWPSDSFPFEPPADWPPNPSPMRSARLFAASCERAVLADGTIHENATFGVLLHTNVGPHPSEKFDSNYDGLWAVASSFGSMPTPWARWIQSSYEDAVDVSHVTDESSDEVSVSAAPWSIQFSTKKNPLSGPVEDDRYLYRIAANDGRSWIDMRLQERLEHNSAGCTAGHSGESPLVWNSIPGSDLSVPKLCRIWSSTTLPFQQEVMA